MSSQSPNETMLRHQVERQDVLEGHINADAQSQIVTTQAPLLNQSFDQATPVQVTTPMLSYLDMIERIEKKIYDRNVFRRWKIGNSESMNAVLAGLRSVSNLSTQKVGLVSIEDMKKAYWMLQNACLTYLSTHNPGTNEGKARFSMVEKIQLRVAQELKDLNSHGGIITEEDKTKTWNELITRSPIMKVTSDRVQASEMADLGATSKVITVTGEDGHVYYYKKKEYMPKQTGDFLALMEEVRGEFTQMRADIDTEGSPLYRMFKTDEERVEKKKVLDEIERMVLPMKRVCVTEQYEINMNSPNAESMIGKIKRFNSTVPEEKRIQIPKEGTEEYSVFKEALSEYLTRFEKKRAMAHVGAGEGRIPKQEDLNVRNEATTILAEQLGISDMIMESHSVTLDQGGERSEGILMREVKGVPGDKLLHGKEYKGKTIQLTPKALNQLITLQVFDIICGQVDRHRNNIIADIDVETVQGKVVVKSISGIDNDLSFGRLSYQGINGTQQHLLPIQDSKGVIALEAIDETFANKILALKPEMIKYLLTPYLSSEDIMACQDRLKGVQQALMDAKKKGRFLSDDSEWEHYRTLVERPKPEEQLSTEEKAKDTKRANFLGTFSYVGTFWSGRSVLGQ